MDSQYKTRYANGLPAAVTLTSMEQWNNNNVPPMFAKPTAPIEATVLGITDIITPDAPGDIMHIALKFPDGMDCPYIEGQSISVIPPGEDPKTGRAFKPRLYSIASARYGDDEKANTISLCIRRAVFWDPELKKEDPEKKGVCSNFLCDAKIGDKVMVSGPVGKTMLLPEDPNADVIMVGTGTGIAPFRSFIHRLFINDNEQARNFKGKAWLFLGVPVTGGLLYQDEFAHAKAAYPDNFDVEYAISREQTNADGTKRYVQNALLENVDEVVRRMDNGAHIYFCGLRGMMPGILEALENCMDDCSVFQERMKEVSFLLLCMDSMDAERRGDGGLGGGKSSIFY